ncbi:hypothetical protein [Streptomyces fuscigenes]|uniref:hypothetical protein n=1 Tax=Streptomyces fuscigenes TaxID=1528880 RepID=UPI001F2CD86B|nr:hypothetical protein [Streptomyces fuscigenes]MCF3963880.1 hypothetical protein [Streptomyces fuscigenes]
MFNKKHSELDERTGRAEQFERSGRAERTEGGEGTEFGGRTGPGERDGRDDLAGPERTGAATGPRDGDGTHDFDGAGDFGGTGDFTAAGGASGRGGTGGDTTAGVKRILGELGSPENVVGSAGAAGSPGSAGRPGGAGGPGQVPRQPASAPSGPHLASMEERGSRPEGKPGSTDWWRVQPGPAPGAMGAGQIQVGGFVGGIEIPEILRPPAGDGAPAVALEKKAPAEGAAGAEPVEEVVAEEAARAWWRRAGGAGGFRLTSPFLVLTAVLLVVGAVLGNIWALLAGWVLAYFSRTLTRSEAKVAVFWLPGVSVAGGVVWLWGRFNERWGDPIPEGTMGQALTDTWPVVVRVAAVASALFLLWRSRRVR